jgi:hypothetical protein
MSRQAQAYLLALGLPAPAILLGVGPLIAMESDPGQFYPAALGVALWSYWTALAATLVLSAVLALGCWRRSRLWGLSHREQVAWSVFVLLFGPAAYVGFLLFRRWPSREPCSSCHAQVARDRTTCAACGTRFPDPAPRGIEIFA